MNAHSSRRAQRMRRGAATTAIISIIVALVAIGSVVMLLNGATSSERQLHNRSDLFAARSGAFNIIVPASGELAALNQIEVRNPLEGRAVITWIIGEGERVKEGDVLIRLADEEIRADIQGDRLNVLSAQSAVTAAANDLAIQQSQNTSRLSQAQTDVEIAQLALSQWEEENISQLEQLAIRLDNAKRNSQRLTEKFEKSNELVAEGIISLDEWKRDEISMIEAQAAAKVAKLDLDVYQNYQSKRERKEHESDVERKKEELERIIQQNEAELMQRTDDLATKQEQLSIRQQDLTEAEAQLSRAVVHAPSDGLVVYASSMESGGWRGNDSSPPQIGSELRRNDFILALPDTSQMIAQVKVHESVSGRISRGLPANVIVDAKRNTTLRGTVLGVSVLAQSGGFRDPNRRDYTVRILLESIDGLELKPSMRCTADIMLDRVDEAVHVPIQAVFRRGSVNFVYVPDGKGFAQKQVTVGRSSELYVEVLVGLAAGDRVLTRDPAENDITSKLDLAEMDAESTRREESRDALAERLPDEAAAAPAGAPPADGSMTQGQPGARGAGVGAGGGMGSPTDFISQYDGNGDGSLQKDELPAQMQSFFDRLDSNSDGSIDMSEMEAAARTMGQGRGAGGGQGGGGGERRPREGGGG